MSESKIDNHRVRYDPGLDYILPVEQSMKLLKDRVRYERKEWHRLHDAPPPGYGIDGYPLMKGKERAK